MRSNRSTSGSRFNPPRDDGSPLLRRPVGVNDVLPSPVEDEFFMDFCEVVSVDTDRCTVSVRTFMRQLDIDNVEFTGPQFDARTGNGVYGPPLPKSLGLVAVVGRKAMLIQATGAIDAGSVVSYANNRERLPPGSWAIRPAQDTKALFLPGLLLFQATNLCRIAIRKAGRLLQAMCYTLQLDTLVGSLYWGLRPGQMSPAPGSPTQFRLELRAALPPARDAQKNPTPNLASAIRVAVGDLPGKFSSYLWHLAAGAVVGVADAKPFGARAESREMSALRTVLQDAVSAAGVQTYADLVRRPADDAVRRTLLTAPVLVAPANSTVSSLVETVLGAVSWVDLDGVLQLLADTVVDDRAANPLANRELRPLGPDWLLRARAAGVTKDTLAELADKLTLVGDSSGGVTCRSRAGLRLHVEQGFAITGPAGAGISCSPDGVVRITGSQVDVRVYQAGATPGTLNDRSTRLDISPGGVMVSADTFVALRAPDIDVGLPAHGSATPPKAQELSLQSARLVHTSGVPAPALPEDAEDAAA